MYPARLSSYSSISQTMIGFMMNTNENRPE
jgi:hypothetical protein